MYLDDRELIILRLLLVNTELLWQEWNAEIGDGSWDKTLFDENIRRCRDILYKGEKDVHSV